MSRPIQWRMLARMKYAKWTLPDMKSDGKQIATVGCTLHGYFSAAMNQGVASTSSTSSLLKTQSYGRELFAPALSTLSKQQKVELLRKAQNRAKRKKGRAVGYNRQEKSISVSDQYVDYTQSTKDILDASAVIVTRQIEWVNVFLHFEQTNKYTIRNRSGAEVGYCIEDDGGFLGVVKRQILRTRRPFSATVYDLQGNILFRLKRPFYFITSSIQLEDKYGGVIGEAFQRFHLLKRNYDLYLDKQQFGEISGNFLAWEFDIKDSNGSTLALIDRNFAGLGIELLTDAGKYVMHFGLKVDGTKDAAYSPNQMMVNQSWASSGLENASTSISNWAKYRTDIQTQHEAYGSDELLVSRSLSSEERAVVLATLICIDIDYFSRHSEHGSRGFMPFFPMWGIWGSGDGGDDDY